MEKHHFMHACREGGRPLEQALQTLHADYGPALLREGWLALRDGEAARDLLQDTLIKIWQRCSSYRGDSELFPWLRQVLRRSAIDRLRRQRPEVPLQDEHGDWLPEAEAALRDGPRATAGPEQAVSDGQLEAVYRRCAARFAAEHPQAAEVIRWITEDDLEPAQVAELLQRSPGATREYISQCRKKARVCFDAWYRLASRRDPS